MMSFSSELRVASIKWKVPSGKCEWRVESSKFKVPCRDVACNVCTCMQHLYMHAKSVRWM